MTRNPIQEEIYAAREEILAEHDGDLAAYVRAANARAKASGHKMADVKQRSMRRTRAEKSPGAVTQDQSTLPS